MKAVTVAPGTAGSVRLEDVPEPDVALGSMVVEALAAGICGTDAEIASGGYGWPPPGRDRLILGHESLGRVVDPGPSGFLAGEHVVGIVRLPDPAPCPNCAVGEWDMCSNGGYTERGIKQADGFMAERWRIEPDYAVRVDKDLGYLGVLLEPATVVAKAWEHIAAIGRRTFWDPAHGPGRRRWPHRPAGRPDRGAAGRRRSRSRPGYLRPETSAGQETGRDVPHRGPRRPGTAPAHRGRVHRRGRAGPAGDGDYLARRHRLPHRSRLREAPAGIPAAALATDVVLKNIVVFGSVNANRRHYYRAAKVLAAADRSWLEQLVTRRVRPDDAQRALQRAPDDIKVVMEFA